MNPFNPLNPWFRHLLPLLVLLSAGLSLLPGCEPKENLLTDKGSLAFSTDTVMFDTVFTRVGTVTKRLWVYNRNGNAVKVDQITLTNPSSSPYSLIINGDAGNNAGGIVIRGNDSLLILVKARLGETSVDKPFIVEDQLNFRTNGNDQLVRLISYGQNAYFHTNTRLACNEVWRDDKPHVLFGVAQVDTGCTLRILPGTRVYAHAGAVLRVYGTLLINQPGDFTPSAGPTDSIKLDNRNIVRFSGDRREPLYEDQPGQWGGILLMTSSTGNRIRYTEIKNSNFGVLLYNPLNAQPLPDLNLDNVVLRNISGSRLSFATTSASTGAGVLSFSGSLTARNCLFTNCGEYAILGVGGSYNLNFCTIANYTPSFRRETASLTFTNEPATTQVTGKLPISLLVRNSIIWGSAEDELFLDNADQYPTPVIENSLLRTKEYAAATGTGAKPSFAGNGNVLNENPKFRRTPENASGRYNYGLDTLSPASNRARFFSIVPRDLLNLPRDRQGPDMGAFERVDP